MVSPSVAPQANVSLAVALPGGSAWAAKKKAAAPPPPRITAFELEPPEKVTTGNELFFRIEGTPGARATVRVGGVSRTLYEKQQERAKPRFF